MSVYFTSDLHFNHKNIINLCQRPFSSVEEMNETLITNWNKTVKQDDQIYILGDLAFGSPVKIREQLERLNGRKTIIFGNHDYELIKAKRKGWLDEYFEASRQIYNLKVQDPDAPKGVQMVVLCHFPIQSWEAIGRGSFHLHGHSHGSLEDSTTLKRFDVGVDHWAKIHGKTPENYRPISYDEVKKIMAIKQFVPVDHHKEGDY